MPFRESLQGVRAVSWGLWLGGWSSGHREAGDRVCTDDGLIRGVPQKGGSGNAGGTGGRGSRLEAMGVEGE